MNQILSKETKSIVLKRFLGNLVTLIICGMICGVFAYFGYDVVKVNDAYWYGVQGLLAGPVIGAAFSILFTLSIFIFCCVWWLISLPGYAILKAIRSII
jgi:hypothetical protein